MTRAESPPPSSIQSLEQILNNPPAAPKKRRLDYHSHRPSHMYDLQLAWPIDSQDDADKQHRLRLPSPRKLFHRRLFRPLSARKVGEARETDESPHRGQATVSPSSLRVPPSSVRDAAVDE